MDSTVIYGMHQLAVGERYVALDPSNGTRVVWAGRVVACSLRQELLVIEQFDGSLAVIPNWNFPGGFHAVYRKLNTDQEVRAPLVILFPDIAYQAAMAVLVGRKELDEPATAVIRSCSHGWCLKEAPGMVTLDAESTVHLFCASDELLQNTVCRLLEVAGKLCTQCTPNWLATCGRNIVFVPPWPYHQVLVVFFMPRTAPAPGRVPWPLLPHDCAVQRWCAAHETACGLPLQPPRLPH